MFEVLNEIVEIQTNRLSEVPTRLEKDRLKEFFFFFFLISSSLFIYFFLKLRKTKFYLQLFFLINLVFLNFKKDINLQEELIQFQFILKVCLQWKQHLLESLKLIQKNYLKMELEEY